MLLLLNKKTQKKQKKDLINIQDLLSPKPLYHKEMFAGKIADWTGKLVPREIYFTCTLPAQNHNHREFGLK